VIFTDPQTSNTLIHKTLSDAVLRFDFIYYLCIIMAKKPFTPIPPMAELPPAEEINVQEILNRYLDGEIDLICVLGPTASGKTRYAVQLARRINTLLEASCCDSASEKRATPLAAGGGARSAGVGGVLFAAEPQQLAGAEIISADSRQVYRGMDIGTGKDLSEYEEIPYHLMDIVDAGSKYNIFEYQRDFEKAYKDIRNRGGVPILCGGSGLYIEAATCGYSLPEVQSDPELRAELEKKTDEELIAQLASLKPLHNTTDYDTRKRLIRALEIAIYEAEHPVQRTSFLPKSTYYIGTLVSREERNARIDRRLDARIEEGMIEEIRGLIDGTHPALAPGHKPVPTEDLIYYGLEYKFVTQHVTGELTLEKMRTQLATAIHQFAKRQMTWFRGMERKGIRIHWTNV
jgi:tRNA dimethylallyltransferase